MRNILQLFLSLLLAVGVCGIVFTVTKYVSGAFSSEQSSSMEQSHETSSSMQDFSSSNTNSFDNSSSNSSNSSDSSDSGNTTPTETVTALTDPSNKSSLVQNGITMNTGAQVLVSDVDSPTIRFSFIITADVKSEIDNNANKTLAALVAPVEYFDEVNTGNHTYIDWVTAFEKANKTVIYSEYDTTSFTMDGDKCEVGFRLQNVLYKNTNRKFVCMLVLATKTGNTTTYRYNGYESGVNYRNNARSLAYVSSAALNAHKFGMETLTASQLATLKSYVNRSVDYANGLTEATDDNSTYSYQVKSSAHANMQVGEKFTITTTITPDVEVPVWYRSSDESVATVNDKGIVTITGKGTVVIGVYVAGQVKGVSITVS